MDEGKSINGNSATFVFINVSDQTYMAGGLGMKKSMIGTVKVFIVAAMIVGTIHGFSGFYGASAAKTEEGSEATRTATTGLPAFAYNEDMSDGSPYLAAICDYLEAEYGNGSGDVMIPAPVVLYTDDSDAENVKIWGNFWTLGYSLEGTCLVCEGGGEAPGVMELTQAEDGSYEVTSFRTAGDGAEYAEGIRTFCEEAEGEDTDSLYDQYMQSNDLSASPTADVRRAFIEQYVADNGLDIDSFQDPGWDPIEIVVSSAEADKSVLESGSLDALRAAAEGYALAVAYIGGTYDITADDWREAIPQGNTIPMGDTADQWPFICDIDAENCAGSQGEDIFCIVPTDPQAKVMVRELSLGEGDDFEMVEGDVIYESENGAPFLLRCNVSDIMPDTRIYVTDSNGDHIYSPSLSLEDGQLYVPDEPEEAAVYDFTAYDAGSY